MLIEDSEIAKTCPEKTIHNHGRKHADRF